MRQICSLLTNGQLPNLWHYMQSIQSAGDCVEELNNSELCGRQICLIGHKNYVLRVREKIGKSVKVARVVLF